MGNEKSTPVLEETDLKKKKKEKLLDRDNDQHQPQKDQGQLQEQSNSSIVGGAVDDVSVATTAPIKDDCSASMDATNGTKRELLSFADLEAAVLGEQHTTTTRGLSLFSPSSSTAVVDIENESVEELARHHLFLVGMVLALARLREGCGGYHDAQPMMASEMMQLATQQEEEEDLDASLSSTTMSPPPTGDGPYPHDIWSVWQEWVRDEEGINPLIGGQDLGVHVLEIDAMGEYLYGICYSPSSRAVTVVLGVSSTAALARLGRAGRMTEYRFPQQERVVGVDAYWGEHILGHTSLLQNVLHQIRLLRVPYTHLSFCGYGAGGALAQIFGIYCCATSNELQAPVLEVWTYGAPPSAGDANLDRLQDEQQQEGLLRHVGFVNQGDLFFSSSSRRSCANKTVWLPQGKDCFGNHPHDLDEYRLRLDDYTETRCLEDWYHDTQDQHEEAQERRLRLWLLLLSLALVYLPLAYVVAYPTPGLFAYQEAHVTNRVVVATAVETPVQKAMVDSHLSIQEQFASNEPTRDEPQVDDEPPQVDDEPPQVDEPKVEDEPQVEEPHVEEPQVEEPHVEEPLNTLDDKTVVDDDEPDDDRIASETKVAEETTSATSEAESQSEIVDNADNDQDSSIVDNNAIVDTSETVVHQETTPMSAADCQPAIVDDDDNDDDDEGSPVDNNAVDTSETVVEYETTATTETNPDETASDDDNNDDKQASLVDQDTADTSEAIVQDPVDSDMVVDTEEETLDSVASDDVVVVVVDSTDLDEATTAIDDADSEPPTEDPAVTLDGQKQEEDLGASVNGNESVDFALDDDESMVDDPQPELSIPEQTDPQPIEEDGSSDVVSGDEPDDDDDMSGWYTDKSLLPPPLPVPKVFNATHNRVLVATRNMRPSHMPPLFNVGKTLRPRSHSLVQSEHVEWSASLIRARMTDHHAQEVFSVWQARHWYASNHPGRHKAQQAADAILQQAQQQNIDLFS